MYREFIPYTYFHNYLHPERKEITRRIENPRHRYQTAWQHCLFFLVERFSKEFSVVRWLTSGGFELQTLASCNAMFYETFICFYVSEGKPLCFSLCSQMFDDVERCWIYNIQNVCHANEQLSFCYFFLINVL